MHRRPELAKPLSSILLTRSGRARVEIGSPRIGSNAAGETRFMYALNMFQVPLLRSILLVFGLELCGSSKRASWQHCVKQDCAVHDCIGLGKYQVATTSSFRHTGTRGLTPTHSIRN